jgi:hypothetical protein
MDNDFTGTIPGDSFGALTDLELISFAVNNLTGSIPSQIGNLPFLEFSSFVDSGLSGNVPESFCAMNTAIPRQQMIATCTGNNSLNLECSCCRNSVDTEGVALDGGGVVVSTTCSEELPDFLFDRLF